MQNNVPNGVINNGISSFNPNVGATPYWLPFYIGQAQGLAPTIFIDCVRRAAVNFFCSVCSTIAGKAVIISGDITLGQSQLFVRYLQQNGERG